VALDMIMLLRRYLSLIVLIFILFRISVSLFRISIKRFVELLRRFLMLKKLPSCHILWVDSEGRISFLSTISGVLYLQFSTTYSDFVGFVLIFAIVLNSWTSSIASSASCFVLKNIQRSSMNKIMRMSMYEKFLVSVSRSEFGRHGIM
jgi:hypothetical protein